MKALIASLIALSPLALQAQITAIPGWDDALFTDSIDWATLGTAKTEIFYPETLTTVNGVNGTYAGSDGRAFLVSEGNGWTGGWEAGESLIWVHWSALEVYLDTDLYGMGLWFQPGAGDTDVIEGSAYLSNFGATIEIYNRGRPLGRYSISLSEADQGPFTGGWMGFTSESSFDSFRVMGDGYVISEVGLMTELAAPPSPSSPSVPVIPEPSMAALAGILLVGSLLMRRRR